MSLLKDKNIVLGVSAGIAAYKAAFLLRLLVKAGAQVRVVMTPASKDFVTPLTLSTLSKNPVWSEFHEEGDTQNPLWNNHVELATWADLILIAPATANTLSKMAQGQCDNMLMAVYLSAHCPVYFAPAMDLDMYQHPTTLQTFQKLQSYGNIMIPAAYGELASGLVGQGRMEEPEQIVGFLEKHIQEGLPLSGKKILITAGPTFEAIDPVRFIGNHSSGKMGYAIAEVAAQMGADVILVSGPSHENINHSHVQLISVVSAEEMYNATHNHYKDSNIAILSAAVADFKPKNTAQEKIKKKDASLIIELEQTQDILKSLGEQKKNQYLVGFALETERELENAQKKLYAKNLDLIVLNSLNDKGAGFGKSTNKVTFISKDKKVKEFPLQTKKQVAKDILNHIVDHYNE